MNGAKPVHLMPPPRATPLNLRLQLLFGGFMNQFGWLFFGFGMIFVWALGWNADLKAWTHFNGSLTTAEGVCLGSEETSAEINEEPVYAYYYRFEHEGQHYEYVSYTSDDTLTEGQAVTVEFQAQDPTVSRIRGMRSAQFPPWALLLVAVFPLVGLGFIIAGIRHGLQAIRLLSTGLLGYGRLMQQEATGMSVNEQPVYQLVFEFKAVDGRTYEARSQTHEPHELMDEEEEALLYSPSNPFDAVLLDGLPGRPTMVSGGFRARSPGSALSVLVLPGLALLVHGGTFLLLMGWAAL
ncbi:MAG: DUF3592 domain-containing protein [Armatimonadetes bacterium]|nr:DUF3592 domain-containing protein [Armatimonadota bacterium]